MCSCGVRAGAGHEHAPRGGGVSGGRAGGGAQPDAQQHEAVQQ